MQYASLRPRFSPRGPTGVTLVELFVVIAMIMVLASLLLPVVHLVREAERWSHCTNSMKQQTVAMQTLHDARNQLPSGGRTNSGHLGGWAMETPPYVEEEPDRTTVMSFSSVTSLNPIRDSAATRNGANDTLWQAVRSFVWPARLLWSATLEGSDHSVINGVQFRLQSALTLNHMLAGVTASLLSVVLALRVWKYCPRLSRAYLLFVFMSSSVWAQPDTIVDLSKTTREFKPHANGILVSFSDTQPPNDVVQPIRPTLFRLNSFNWQAVQRAQKLGAEIIIIVCDEYAFKHMHGYADPSGKWPGDAGDWLPWEEHCRNLARTAQEKGVTVIWDLWNEPSIGVFWKRDFARYLETWKRGVEAIRSVDRKAHITGPSFHAWDRKLMTEFLRFAKHNRVLPQSLNWHELGRPHQLVHNVEDARVLLREHDVAIDRIIIPEIVAEDRQFFVGHTAAFLAAAHRAAVDGACHSCWGELGGNPDPTAQPLQFNCVLNSLDGLLTHDTHEPRATWWVYKTYADLAGDEVAVSAGSPATSVLAVLDSFRHVARLLVARCEEDLNGPPKSLQLRINGISSLGASSARRGVSVKVTRIGNSGHSALLQPTNVFEDKIAPVRDAITIRIPNALADDAFAVAIAAGEFPSARPEQLTPAAKPSSFVFSGESAIQTPLKRFFPVTLEAWVRPETNEKDVFVIGASSATHQGIGLGLSSAHVRAQYLIGDFGASTVAPAAEWSHIAGVYGSNATFLFLNGKQVAKGPGNKEAKDNPLFVIGDIGKDYSGHRFKGQIRSVRISDGLRYSGNFQPETKFAKDPAHAKVRAVLIYDASLTRSAEATDLSENNNHGRFDRVTIKPIQK